MRVVIWTSALALGALLLAACGGGSNGTSSDTASTGGSDASTLIASCRAIGEIQSYRYTISLKLQSPAFQGSNEANPEDPLSPFAEALSALFADMRLEGAYVAPNRSQTVLQNEDVELRTIGDESWVRVGTTWQKQGSSAQLGALLTPHTICEEIVNELAPSLSGLASRRETINGIEADHYQLDEADLKRLPEFLGAGSEASLPQRFLVDLWLARHDRWPVRLRIFASDTNEEAEPIGLELFMEFRDINDPAIEIEPPLLSPIET